MTIAHDTAIGGEPILNRFPSTDSPQLALLRYFLAASARRLRGGRACLSGFQDRVELLYISTDLPLADSSLWDEESIARHKLVTASIGLGDQHFAFQQLATDSEQLSASGIKTLKPIGDCYGPAIIAAAVYEGHRFARELGETVADIPFEREITELATTFELP